MLDKLDAYSKSVDVYPIVKHYMKELNLFELFKKYVPKGDAELEPAEGLCIMIVNILTANRPLYKVEEWLADYADGKGEAVKQASKYNDDRLGRNCLDKLYKANRHNLMTSISAMAIKVHGLLTNVFHNDTTSLTLRGAYDKATDGVKPARGYNKDGHRDCKQIVFGLNVTGDGHVPISYKAFNGNTNDSDTHIPNWDKLREFLDKEDFIYVADSKVADKEIMEHIADNGGKFISVLPATRNEVKEFRNRLKKGEKIAWEQGYRKEDSRKKGEFTNYHTFETKSQEDYRILWIHSDSKARADAMSRQKKLNAACQELKIIASKLNRYQLKSREKIEQAVQKATKGVKDYLTVQVTEHTTKKRKQIGRGRAGSNTEYTDISQTTFELKWQRNSSALQEAARTDGIFPLISNCKLPASEVLRTYKQQSYLEKRHSTLKTVEQVCPIYLKKPERIEAMLFLYYVALMIISLMERNIRNQMQEVSALGSKTPVAQAKQELPKGELEVSAHVANDMAQTLESEPKHELPKSELEVSAHVINDAAQTLKSEPKHELLKSELEVSAHVINDAAQTLKSEPNHELPKSELEVSAHAINDTAQTLESEPVLLEEPIKTQKTAAIKPQVLPSPQSTKPLPIILPEEGSKPVEARKPQVLSIEQPITLPEEAIKASEQKTIPSLPESKAVIAPIKRLSLPILPNGLKTETPTWANLKYFFRNVYQEVITSSGDIVKTILKGMTSLHFQVLELLGVPACVYDDLDGPWFRFQK